MIGRHISLDGEWHFKTDVDNAGLHDEWYRPQIILEDSWDTLQIPAFWEQHGRDGYEGVAWYRREFDLPPPTPGEQNGLCLAGIDQTATVWINGVEITNEDTNHRRFARNLDRRAKPGNNAIVIRVPDRGVPGGMLLGAWIGPYRDIDELRHGKHHATPARASADWVRDAVIYEVYLRSFSPEGTFQGLERQLDDLRELGITVIWLMPIHPVGKTRRKGPLGSPYSISDYYAVNPEFGTLDDFKSLLTATHERGMKLIIDLVANHTAWDNPLIHEHPDWFARDKRGDIRSPADWTDVAQLDYTVPELRRYMTEMMLYWVRDVGIDGFRCDVAGMLPTDFWNDAREELDAVKPVMMLAEDDQPARHARAFDLTYDWWTYQALGRLRAGKLNPASIATILANEELDFPAGSLRLRFSSNHDLCAWHKPGLERYGPDAAKAAAVLTFTLPGVPLIYNGQEAGNRNRLHLFERTPIDWNTDDHGLRELFTTLARLRRARSSLRRSRVYVLDPLAKVGVLGLARTWHDETTYTLINYALELRQVELEQLPQPPSATLLSSAPVNRGAHPRRIELPPMGFWIAAAH